MRTFIYTRVSGQGQVDNGQGLDIQEDECRGYAGRQGWDVAQVFREEGVSGTKPAHERPALTDLLAEVDDGDVVLVSRLDRLARQLTTQEAVLAAVWGRGATVHAVDQGEVLQDDPDDPMRTAMRQMAGVFAELDRAMVVKRLRDGRRRKAATGGKGVGRWPYGWTAGGEAVEEEQNVLRYVQALRAEGHTWQQVANRLNNRGWHQRNGRAWTVANLSKLARSSRQS